MKTRTFIDQTIAEVKAGRGGDGSASFRRESMVPEGGPDGGDGGIGGNVILEADPNTDSLTRIFFEPRLWAEDGIPGRGQKMHGRNGEDLIVKVPCGTEVYDADTEAFIGEVVAEGERLTIAEGGKGGWGNVHFKSSVNQAPERFNPGKDGAAFRARFELKTIADAGLVGFPNAGKSSLLAALSDAKPKIASYPFTTLHPIVGTVVYPDYASLRVADVPGIIEGAAEGTGLGLTFLKHLARSRMLIYVIDMAGTDNREPWRDYTVLQAEVAQYDPDLAERPAFVIANKMDEEAAIVNLPRFMRETGVAPFQLSLIEEGQPGLEAIRKALYDQIKPAVRRQFGTQQPPPASGKEASAREEELKGEEEEGGFISEEKFRRMSFFDISRKKK